MMGRATQLPRPSLLRLPNLQLLQLLVETQWRMSKSSWFDTMGGIKLALRDNVQDFDSEIDLTKTVLSKHLQELRTRIAKASALNGSIQT